jgi:hypothetical protein
MNKNKPMKNRTADQRGRVLEHQIGPKLRRLQFSKWKQNFRHWLNYAGILPMHGTSKSLIIILSPHHKFGQS